MRNDISNQPRMLFDGMRPLLIEKRRILRRGGYDDHVFFFVFFSASLLRFKLFQDNISNNLMSKQCRGLGILHIHT